MTDLGFLLVAPLAFRPSKSLMHKPPTLRVPARRKSRRDRTSLNQDWVFLWVVCTTISPLNEGRWPLCRTICSPRCLLEKTAGEGGITVRLFLSKRLHKRHIAI